METTLKYLRFQLHNYTGQYHLPENQNFHLIAFKDNDEDDGTDNTYQLDNPTHTVAMDYLQNTLIPDVQDKISNLSGDDDYFDNIPAYLEEVGKAINTISGNNLISREQANQFILDIIDIGRDQSYDINEDSEYMDMTFFLN